MKKEKQSKKDRFGLQIKLTAYKKNGNIKMSDFSLIDDIIGIIRERRLHMNLDATIVGIDKDNGKVIKDYSFTKLNIESK